MNQTMEPTARTEVEGMNKIIHAAFRRDLDRITDELAAVRAGSRPVGPRLLATWEHFTYQLHTHHHDEETFFWPAFTALGADPITVTDLHGEHDVMVDALRAAEGAMAVLADAPSAAGVATAERAVGWLRHVLLVHLAHEEQQMDPFADTQLSSREFKAAQRSSRKVHTEGAGNFFAWLSDGCSPEVRRALHHEVPAPVLHLLVRLGGRRYTRTVGSLWRTPG